MITAAGVLAAIVLLLATALLGGSVRIVRQFERGVVFRFGRVEEGTTRGPGLALLRCE